MKLGYLQPFIEYLRPSFAIFTFSRTIRHPNTNTITITNTNVFVNNFVNRPLDDILMLMLRPFKFLNWNTNKDKLLDPALVYDMNHINDISDINDGRKTSFDKPGGGGAP